MPLGVGSPLERFIGGSARSPLLTPSFLSRCVRRAPPPGLFSLAIGRRSLCRHHAHLAALGRALESPHLQVHTLSSARYSLSRHRRSICISNPQSILTCGCGCLLFLFSCSVLSHRKLAALRDDPGSARFAASLLLRAAVSCSSPLVRSAGALAAPRIRRFCGAPVRGRARMRYHALAWHSHLLTGLGLFTALTADLAVSTSGHISSARFQCVAGRCRRLLARQAAWNTDERHLALARVATRGRHRHDGLGPSGSAPRALDCRWLDRFRRRSRALHALDRYQQLAGRQTSSVSAFLPRVSSITTT